MITLFVVTCWAVSLACTTQDVDPRSELTAPLQELKSYEAPFSFTVRRTRFEEVPIDHEGTLSVTQTQEDRILVCGRQFRESSTIKDWRAGSLTGTWRQETADDGDFYRTYRDVRDERGRMTFLVMKTKSSFLLPLLRDPILLAEASVTTSRVRFQRSLVHLLQSSTVQGKNASLAAEGFSVRNRTIAGDGLITFSFDREKSIVRKIVAVDSQEQPTWSFVVNAVREMPEHLTGWFIEELTREDIHRDRTGRVQKQITKVEVLDVASVVAVGKESFVLSVPTDSRVVNQSDKNSPSFVMRNALAGSPYDPTYLHVTDTDSAGSTEYETELLRRAREADDFRINQRVVAAPAPRPDTVVKKATWIWFGVGTVLLLLSVLAAGLFWNERNKKNRVRIVELNN